MLNPIFFVFVVGSVLAAALVGKMPEVTDAAIKAAKTSAELAIGLIGQMALWLGFMRIVRDAGLMRWVANGLDRILRPLFPEIPAGHPAMGAVVMNFAANMMGLANAATPFGLKAMRELDKLNARPGVATNAMVMFLSINTAGVAVLPLTVIAVRATVGSKDPAGIVLPSILAAMVSTITAVILVKLLERLPIFSVERATVTRGEVKDQDNKEMAEAEEIAFLDPKTSPIGVVLTVLFVLGMTGAAVLAYSHQPAEKTGFGFIQDLASYWLLPVLMSGILLAGISRNVKVYESFIKGAKEGFDISVMIIPYLVAILVGVGMFRASGLMDVLITAATPLTNLIAFPAELLPMALIRPLSGSGAMGVMSETMKTYGPDSFLGYAVSVMNGSTETTFYVLAVYFGSVGVRATRHTLIPCIVADVTGLVSAVYFSRLFWHG